MKDQADKFTDTPLHICQWNRLAVLACACLGQVVVFQIVDVFEDARTHCQVFFPWYNDSHRHSGIGYMTPAAVHHGQPNWHTHYRQQRCR